MPKYLKTVILLCFIILSSTTSNSIAYSFPQSNLSADTIEHYIKDNRSGSLSGLLQDLRNEYLQSTNPSFSSQLNIQQVAVPYGRSAQAYKTSLTHPRTLVSIGGIGFRSEPASYMANVDGDDEIEAIIWNRFQNLYEFKVFRNFKNGEAPVEKVIHEKSCFTCHQGEGPIFSSFPWSEMTGDDSFRFDISVRRGNKTVQYNRFCESMCTKGDVQCNLNLLSHALNRRVNIPANLPSLQDLIQKAQSVGDFSYPSDVLPDRKVKNGNANESITMLETVSPRKLDRLKSGKGDFKHSISQSMKNQLISARYSTTYIEKSGDESFAGPLVQNYFRGVSPLEPSSPIFKRPNVSPLQSIDNEALSGILVKCFPIDERLKEKIQKIPGNELISRLFSSKCSTHLWDQGGLDQELLSQIILDGCTSLSQRPHQKAPPDADRLADARPLLTLLSVPMSPSERNRSALLLEQNCLSCHGPQKFMDLKLLKYDTESFGKYRSQSGVSASMKIISKSMPPDRDLLPEEENLLLKALGDWGSVRGGVETKASSP